VKHLLENFQLKEELGQAQALHYTHMGLIILAYLSKIYNGDEGLFALVKIAGLIFVYHLYFKTLKSLYYTFWSFSFGIAVFLFVNFWNHFFGYYDTPLSYVYLLALLALAIECYIVASPVFYPRVSWWEYDFRYRGDLKTIVKVGDQEVEGRLTDLRRGAGCVVLFDEFDIGRTFRILTSLGDIKFDLNAEVMSKREDTVGRGITYGVKFLLDSSEKREFYDTFCSHWSKSRTLKRQLKLGRDEL
jgi:hypothetical protein